MDENHELYVEGKELSEEDFRLAFKCGQVREKRLAKRNENERKRRQADFELIE